MDAEDIPASLEVSGELEKLVDYVTGGADTVYLTKNGRAAAVLVDIDHYNALLDAADAQDASLGETEAGFMESLLKQYGFRSRSHQA